MKVINFTNNYPDFVAEDHLRIQALEKCYQDQSLGKAVCFVFVDDETLLSINIQALKHDYYTDIITFDYGEDPDYDCSEIYISVDRIRENAESYKTEFGSELLRVCLHGLLHLGGYNDKTEAETEKMRAAEQHYLDLPSST